MESTSPTPLGNRLRSVRERAGVQARELDRLAQITEGHTTLIESGRRREITGRILGALAGALGVEPMWLLNGDGEAPRDSVVDRAVARARREHEARKAAPKPKRRPSTRKAA